MVQLRILSGPQAGDFQVVRRFPFRIGRGVDNDLPLDAAGVWDHHLMLEFQRGQGIALRTVDQAFAAVNDHPQSAAALRNGDVISFGSVKLQFWLAPPIQRGLRVREWFIWALLVVVSLGQVAIIYWLLLR